MQIMTTENIITKKVLNEASGELEVTDFKEVKKTKFVKGGFTMVYKSYDEALTEVVRSNLDLRIVLYIRSLFTYRQTEVHLSPVKLAEKLDTSTWKIKTVIKAMIDANMLMKVGNRTNSICRLNPYMYLPYKAEAGILQKEWTDLKNKESSL